MNRNLPASVSIPELLDCLPSGLVLTGKDGRIQFVNRAFTQITGYTLEDCAGQTPRILKSGHHKEEEYAVLWKTLLAGHEYQGRFINKKKDGSLYWEYLQIYPLRDPSGDSWFLAVIEDITGLQGSTIQEISPEEESADSRARLERLVLAEKRMLSQLEKLLSAERNVNTMRADLIRVLSHEFRTPLSVIQSSADILKSYRSQMDSETIDRRLDKIASMVSSITALLDDALGIWQTEESSKTRVPVGEVIRELVESRFASANREANLSIGAGAEVLVLEGAHHVRNMLLPVLDSAARFAPPGTAVSVEIKPGADSLEIFVRDKSLQDPRAETLDSFITETGTGLDRAIVRRAQKKLQGGLQIERSSEGTTVHLHLPLLASS